MDEQIKSNVTIILNLEYLGVRFEETKDEPGPCGLLSKTAYYFSVPETSTLDVENEELNCRIKTAHDLKYLAKETLIDMMCNSCKAEFGEDATDFISYVKNNINDYFKFYAKVRKGEVWNKELAEQRIREIDAEIDQACGYTEV